MIRFSRRNDKLHKMEFYNATVRNITRLMKNIHR